MLNILEKYKPNNSIGFIGHFKFVNDFKNRMKDNNFNKLLLCIGESGIGKTDLLKTIFKELHFDYVEFYNSESFKTEIDNYINLKRIDSFFKKNNKKLIFIDDFELFLNDKNSLNYISNLNSKNIPIVCIINKIYSRKFNDLKKKNEVFYISKIGVDKCYNHIIQICNNENYDLENKDLLNIKNFVKKTNSNLKYILINLSDLLKNPDNTIDYNEVDKDLYDTLNILIKKKCSIEELEKIIFNDISLICMLLHENFTNIINKKKIKEYYIEDKNNKNNKNNKNSTNDINNVIIEMYRDILEDICLSDILEKNIFQEVNWNNYGLMGLIKIYKINHYYSKFKHDEFNKINFTQILTKYSLRYNFNKKKFSILDDNNISYNYLDYIIQGKLFKVSNSEDNDTEDNKISDLNKEYIDILKKYNKEYNLIDNKILNKLK
tara:strand:+ start:2010 stop:3314 length:1305 start_codon:yes stop_codon:yes gene_type:complete